VTRAMGGGSIRGSRTALDNDAAEVLWERIGYGRGLFALGKLAALTDTKITLPQLLEVANKLLTDASARLCARPALGHVRARPVRRLDDEQEINSDCYVWSKTKRYALNKPA